MSKENAHGLRQPTQVVLVLLPAPIIHLNRCGSDDLRAISSKLWFASCQRKKWPPLICILHARIATPVVARKVDGCKDTVRLEGTTLVWAKRSMFKSKWWGQRMDESSRGKRSQAEKEDTATVHRGTQVTVPESASFPRWASCISHHKPFFFFLLIRDDPGRTLFQLLAVHPLSLIHMNLGWKIFTSLNPKWLFHDFKKVVPWVMLSFHI